MSTSEETIAALQSAVRLSPENAPLRVHLADTLLAAGQAEEAEKHFREALRANPGDSHAKLGLASAFARQGKHSYALVVVEELIRQPNPGGAVLVFYSRLLMQIGDVEQAVDQYKKGIALSPESADPELASRLGITGRRTAPVIRNDDTAGEEVVDGKLRSAETGDVEPGPAYGDDVERPSINFKDVGGMEPLKEEIRMKIIHPLANADLFRATARPSAGASSSTARQDAVRPIWLAPPPVRSTRRFSRSASAMSSTCGSEKASGISTMSSSAPGGISHVCCSSTRSTPWRPAGWTCAPPEVGM